VEKKDDKSSSKQKKPKEERRFSQEQYDMLKRCSDNKDMTEWNEWRKEHLYEEIWLQGAELILAHLERANLGKVHLERANLGGANLQGASLFEANLQGANFDMANLQSANLQAANLEGAFIPLANLEDSDFIRANLQDAHIMVANLQGAILRAVNLRGANLENAVVNGRTLIWECAIDRNTNLRGVGLDSVRIDSGTRQLLEYNIRRMNWEEWYKEHWFWRWPVRKFWQISDYGISTKQIIKTFFQWALIFAAIYLAWGLIDYHLVGLKDVPGIVSNLFVLEGEQETVSPWLVPFRSVYFSIVTMTTLGFGDMYANAHSFLRGLFGHALLALQVILGYVLLGALITRFAVLFTGGGPAGTFKLMDKETEKLLAKLKEKAR